MSLVLLPTPMDGTITELVEELRRANVGHQGDIADQCLHSKAPDLEAADSSRGQT